MGEVALTIAEQLVRDHPRCRQCSWWECSEIEDPNLGVCHGSPGLPFRYTHDWCGCYLGDDTQPNAQGQLVALSPDPDCEQCCWFKSINITGSSYPFYGLCHGDPSFPLRSSEDWCRLFLDESSTGKIWNRKP